MKDFFTPNRPKGFLDILMTVGAGGLVLGLFADGGLMGVVLGLWLVILSIIFDQKRKEYESLYSLLNYFHSFNLLSSVYQKPLSRISAIVLNHII